ncbi:MAG: bifunctional aspartate kinase/homoserine dehydrogenase I [Crocinitomicaceae bacterium]|nr:bifunctional aspartate kinase/homoserine dehydrogenase I [Flavobacteriales bacterium]NQZ36645.1 bifunctional aspartate kinase/homoserine dehydrogenase I [Crocinitomicaceae bacterium]
MIVIKFGGTSISSRENIEQISSILDQKNENYVVVVSAFSGITNLLEHISEQAIKADVTLLIEEFRDKHFSIIKDLLSVSEQTELLLKAQQISNELEAICGGVGVLKELSSRTKARILSFGEQLSSVILHKHLSSQGKDIDHLDSRKLILATGDYLKGKVDFQQTSRNITALNRKNYIASGFIASNYQGETITLGRGGSDYSASIYASVLNASSLEIWSDVNGMHSANPKHVTNTKPIQKMSYEEAFELASFGVKVLYPISILPVMTKKIPVYLKNTFYPEQEGTLISDENFTRENKIQGVSSLNNISILTVSGLGLAKQKGRARKVFQTLEENDVNIILITQSCSEQSIGIGIDQNDLSIAEVALNDTFESEIEKGMMNAVKVVKDQCIIALVGDNMKHKVGLSGKVFGAIGENGINITAITQGASERNISLVIDQKEEVKALNVIHEQFFNETIKTVHLFIAGVGNVGNEFLKIIEAQHEKLMEEHKIRIKIVGLANSKCFLINERDGLGTHDLLELNKKGKSYDSFLEYSTVINELNLRNSVFIDNTASEMVSSGYASLLRQSVSVVTCNKIACSGEYENYIQLKKLATDYNCSFKYETSVGAALPIIKTIQDLTISGDVVNKIEAVISGSLNFIFNKYDAGKTFSDVVLQAKKEGYTEPDPLIDLSGLDVMRKILILSRESGYRKELSDINFEHFLPESCTQARSKKALFEQLEKNEPYFKSLFENAQQKGNRLKVIASMNMGEMIVGLQEVPPNSPFFNLEGKDNIITINTNRYDNEPLVIKGAGAGASVTASGVFADLMFIINR